MDLLEKFESIEVRADTRISEADRIFCEAHQSAYENAAAALKELKYFWDDMVSQQKELLAPTDAAPTNYLLSPDGLKLSGDAIQTQLRSLHSIFIEHLVSYFSITYHFSISSQDVGANLLPQKPSDRWTDNYKESVKKYTSDLQELALHYNDILEQIFLQTGGRAFAEQALYELKKNCRRTAWNTYQKRADYTRKKSTLQFTHYACSFRSYYRANGSWELTDGMKDVLKGISHFETGGFSTIPDALAKLINGYSLDFSDYDFPDCKKVQSLKMFKNRRVDIRFSEESYARQFAEEYLGTVCPYEA